ncbi:MAG: 5-guanidino-2-oxopentanoate decarboxylase [Myxococcales bacterium]|nr:5-guanidino-2-oxopentanoate decarboxylase [Myxococcales bacterium]
MGRTCGEALVEMLEGHGVDTLFGIPGAHTLELYRGISNTKIRHITPRHEQGAGFMADGYARATGRPGVCFAISGPGVTNTLTALGQALGDSIPVLLVSSVAATHDIAMGEGRLHAIDSQRALTSHLTRWSHTLLRPDELPKVLARAFSLFASARPGPVHLEIPLDVLAAPAEHLDLRPWPTTSPPAATPEVIRQASLLLDSASSPIIAVGGGAQDAASELQTLAERLDAPVVNTVNAKGLLPADHALAVCGSVSCAPVRQALESADVVLAVGTELGETDYDYEFAGDLELSGKLVRIDIEPAQLSRNARAEVAICSDARNALRALCDQAPVHPRDRRGKGRVRELRAAVAACREPFLEAFFATIQQQAPDAVVVGDSTRASYYAWMQFDPAGPRSYFHSASGFGTLGYAIPAAIGAKLAHPTRPVIALLGDGGALFTVAELAVAAQLQLPVIFIIWNNSEYREIRTMMQARDITPIGVSTGPVDFCAVAEALGCRACRIESLAQLDRELAKAREHDGPLVLEIIEQETERHFAGHGTPPHQ